MGLCSFVEKKVKNVVHSVLHLFMLQPQKAHGVLGDGLRCLALTSMSRRLLHRRYDMRGEEGNAALHRCEERRMFKLFKMIQ